MQNTASTQFRSEVLDDVNLRDLLRTPTRNKCFGYIQDLF